MRVKIRLKAYSGSGNYKFYLDGLRVNGKRKRIFFKNRKEAEEEFERLSSIQRASGQAGLNLPEHVRSMAVECTAALSRFPGQTILDATRFYVTHLERLSSSILTGDLLAEYLQAKTRANLSAVHLIDIRNRLARFRQSFAARPLRSVTTAEIGQWLSDLELSPQSINNFRCVIRSAFGYAVEHGHLDRNPVDAIQKAKTVDGPPVIFTPEALATLLRASPGHLLPALAIGAFAGLRSAELWRLEWKEVNLESGLIEVTAAKAKTARRRLIPISSNLAAWLRPYVTRRGQVFVGSFGHYYDEIARVCAATGVEWQANGLRHSFASYHLAKHRDAKGLALDMGHTSSDMVFGVYREVVTPAAADKYWSISPEAAA